MLVFHAADFEVVVFDSGVYGLDGGGEVRLGHVAGGPWALGVWRVLAVEGRLRFGICAGLTVGGHYVC